MASWREFKISSAFYFIKVLCFPEKLILQNYDINKKMSKK